MKKIIFFGAFIITIAPLLHAKKIGCQFEAIRQKIEMLRENATHTWKAIKKLNKKLMKHEDKMMMRHYKYNNPYINTNPVKTCTQAPVIAIEATQDDMQGNQTTDAALLINALQQAIGQ